MADERGADAPKEDARKCWEKADTEGRKLDVRQYPELNAIFYTANPSEFVKMRINALSAMAAPDVFLGPVFAINRPIASWSFPASLYLRSMRVPATSVLRPWPWSTTLRKRYSVCSLHMSIILNVRGLGCLHLRVRVSSRIGWTIPFKRGSAATI